MTNQILSTVPEGSVVKDQMPSNYDPNLLRAGLEWLLTLGQPPNSEPKLEPKLEPESTYTANELAHSKTRNQLEALSKLVLGPSYHGYLENEESQPRFTLPAAQIEGTPPPPPIKAQSGIKGITINGNPYPTEAKQREASQPILNNTQPVVGNPSTPSTKLDLGELYSTRDNRLVNPETSTQELERQVGEEARKLLPSSPANQTPLNTYGNTTIPQEYLPAGQARGASGTIYSEGSDFNKSVAPEETKLPSKADYAWYVLQNMFGGRPAMTREELGASREANIAQNKAIAQGAPYTVDKSRQEALAQFLSNERERQTLPYAGAMEQANLGVRQGVAASAPLNLSSLILSNKDAIFDLVKKQNESKLEESIKQADLDYRQGLIKKEEAEAKMQAAREAYYQEAANAKQAETLLNQYYLDQAKNFPSGGTPSNKASEQMQSLNQ